MTSGQLAQLQDLSKCYMPRRDKGFVTIWLDPFWYTPEPMTKWDKARLRGLTHLYRHQIAAVKRNQKVTA